MSNLVKFTRLELKALDVWSFAFVDCDIVSLLTTKRRHHGIQDIRDC